MPNESDKALSRCAEKIGELRNSHIDVSLDLDIGEYYKPSTSEAAQLKALRMEVLVAMRDANPFLTAAEIHKRFRQAGHAVSISTISTYIKEDDTEKFAEGFDKRGIFMAQVRGLRETISDAYENNQLDIVIKGNQRLAAMLDLDGYDAGSNKIAIETFLGNMRTAFRRKSDG